MSRIRVLFCLDEFEGPTTGGTERQFWLLYNELPRAHFEPSILLLRQSTFLAGMTPAPNILAIRSLRNPVSWLRLARLTLTAWRQDIDLAVLYLNDVSLCLPPFLKLAGVKVLVSRRDLGIWYTRWNLPILRALRPFVDGVLVNSKAVGEVVAREEGYDEGRILLLRNAFASQHPSPILPGDTAHVPNRFHMVHVANLRPLKRIEDAVRALARLRFQGVPASLSIVGRDGRGTCSESYRRELESLADSLEIGSFVSFIGHVENPERFVTDADVALLCSGSEGLANAVVEYMYLGKAIACADAGGNAEIISDGSTGFLYPAGDVDRLTAILHALWLDPDLRLRIGRQAADSARTLFDVDSMIVAATKHFRSVLRTATCAD